jgi:hypothetical protein
VDPGGSWLPLAGSCPAVQERHGARDSPSGEIGTGPRLSEQLEEFMKNLRMHHEGGIGNKGCRQ